MIRPALVSGATIAVPDLCEVSAAIAAAFGLAPPRPGPVPGPLAEAWGARIGACTEALLTLPGKPATHLRLVEAAGSPPASLSRRGWCALGFVSSSVKQAALRMRSAGFEQLEEPRRLDVAPRIRAAQFGLPGGAAVYLSEAIEPIGGLSLPRSRAPLGRLFIAVLGATDGGAAAGELFSLLGGTVRRPSLARVRALNRALHRPGEATTELRLLSLGRSTHVEIDAVGAGVPAAEPVLGDLRGPIGCVAFEVARIPQELRHRARRIDAEPYRGRFVAGARGPEGALVELIGAAPLPPGSGNGAGRAPSGESGARGGQHR